jgi:hypothetical protein
VSALPPPPLPSPAALRLVSRAEAPKLKPPMGLARWDADANDRALLLDRPSTGDAPTLEEVAAQIPLPGTLTAGTMVVVLGDAAPASALLGRLLGARVRIPRHLRASALLAAGYTRIGGAVDPKTGNDLAWGYAP